MQFILLFAWVDLVAVVRESGLAELISNSQKFSHVLAGHFRKIDLRNYSSVPTSPVLILPYMLVLGQKCPYFCDFGILP